MYVSINVCIFVCMYVCVYVCMYVCMNRAGSDGQFSYVKSLERHTKKDVDICERISPVFIEKCTRW